MSDTVYPRSIITDDYFKAYSPIPKNYNLDELRPYVHVAEVMWIVPIIGSPLYDELLEQVENDNVTPENATLLLAIYPLLSFAIVTEALPFIAYHMSQVGVTKGKSENSDSVSINDVNYINTTLRSQCEIMKSNLKKFLDEHSDLYPKYYSDKSVNCSCDENCSDYLWISQYYNGGNLDKHEWMRLMAKHNMNRFKPQSYNQLYTTRRICTEIR